MFTSSSSDHSKSTVRRERLKIGSLVMGVALATFAATMVFTSYASQADTQTSDTPTADTRPAETQTTDEVALPPPTSAEQPDPPRRQAVRAPSVTTTPARSIGPATFVCPSGTTGSPTASDPFCDGKSIVETAPATPETNYGCPADSERSGSGAATTCTVRSVTTQAVDAVAFNEYSCPVNAVPTGSGPELTCSTETVAKQSVAATATADYFCPAGAHQIAGSGWKLLCAKDVTNVVVPTESTMTFTCPAGAVPSKASELVCEQDIVTQKSVPSIVTASFTCPQDASVTGGSGATTTCGTEVVTDKPVATTSSTHYHCQDGWTSSGSGSATTCNRTFKPAQHSAAPTCATGTLTPSGTHCYLPAVVTPQTNG